MDTLLPVVEVRQTASTLTPVLLDLKNVTIVASRLGLEEGCLRQIYIRQLLWRCSEGNMITWA